MKLYAEVPVARWKQVAGDAATIVWIAVWIRIGIWMDTLVTRLEAPGRAIESAGRGFERNLTSAAERVADVPVVGDSIRSPLDAAAGAGASLAAAGERHQEVVHLLALWLGVLLAVIPIGYVLLRYVPSRWRWLREASAAARLRVDAEDLQLFAIRAVATRPLYELRSVCADPAHALASGDFAPLARLELEALGLQLPVGEA